VAVTAADYRLAHLAGEPQHLIVFRAIAHTVKFQGMNRPAETPEQIQSGYPAIFVTVPWQKRVIQDDQASQSMETIEQVIQSPFLGCRLKLIMGRVDVACRQAGNAEMEKMISESYRQLLAESDVIAGAALVAEKFPSTADIVVIRDGEEETVKTETTSLGRNRDRKFLASHRRPGIGVAGWSVQANSAFPRWLYAVGDRWSGSFKELNGGIWC